LQAVARVQMLLVLVQAVAVLVATAHRLVQPHLLLH
jgi:hypothetical protein